MKIYLVIYQEDFREHKVFDYDDLMKVIESRRPQMGDPKIIYLMRVEE